LLSVRRSGLANGYRVLGSDGKPRPDFHWDSPDDIRNVIIVLTEDGVRFSASSAAEPSQRITAAELSSLIDDLDEDEVEIVERSHGSDDPATDAADRDQIRAQLSLNPPADLV
jgi:hypothetical protein